jgi:hypothetical protein
VSVEVLGYLASALVVAALSMKSVVRLRALSLCGSVAFLAYGALIESIPIVLTNLAIAALNVAFLARELGGGRDVGVTIVPPDSPFLADFLHHHATDIRSFQPGARIERAGDLALVLNRDNLPAGAVIGHADGDELVIDVDYVLPAYRDSRLGAWLYGPGASVFRDAGFRKLCTDGANDTHRAYLRRMGFDQTGPNRFELAL